MLVRNDGRGDGSWVASPPDARHYVTSCVRHQESTPRGVEPWSHGVPRASLVHQGDYSVLDAIQQKSG